MDINSFPGKVAFPKLNKVDLDFVFEGFCIDCLRDIGSYKVT